MIEQKAMNCKVQLKIDKTADKWRIDAQARKPTSHQFFPNIQSLRNLCNQKSVDGKYFSFMSWQTTERRSIAKQKRTATVI